MKERIEGSRIVLRKAREEDLNAIYSRIWSNPEVYESMWYAPTADRETARDRMARTIAFQRGHDAFFVALKQTDEAIGFCGVRELGDGIFEERGLCIAPEYQGQGLGRELLGLLLRYMFYERNARECRYSCIRENERSKRLCMSFGFRYAGAEEQLREWDGKTFTLDRYVLRREELKEWS